MVVRSKRFSMGENVKAFEEEFARYFQTKYSIMVNSGSSANLLAVAALFYKKSNPLKRGDEVIVPAVSWSTTYYPLYQYGLKVKFVDIDIDIDTLNFNLKQLKSAITDKTRMIFAVNLLGNPNDFKEINDFTAERNIYLLEDNCEAMGAKLNNKFTGTYGLMGTYSTFFSHHISTMEGGVITTEDEELYHILLSIRSHGWTRNLPQKNQVTGEKDQSDFKETFKFVLPGYNVRPLEMSAAIGLEQLKKLSLFIDNRRKNALLFNTIFKDSEYFHIQQEIGESSWFGFSFILKPSYKDLRDRFVSYLEENKVECRPIVSGNFVKNDVLRFFEYEIHGNLENASYLDEAGLFVGNHHYDMENEIMLLKKVVYSFFER